MFDGKIPSDDSQSAITSISFFDRNLIYNLQSHLGFNFHALGSAHRFWFCYSVLLIRIQILVIRLRFGLCICDSCSNKLGLHGSCGVKGYSWLICMLQCASTLHHSLWQGERALGLISRFMQARARKGSDHGIKAQGDGWLLTVALIEGSKLAAVDSSGFCDPYVVFTCNGKTRSSSIKFKESDPLWKEIFEFDAMEDPPSVLDVDVYDFDGPFVETACLGNAEINFLKTNISDLADIWVSLDGKLALASQSKLHLRIFLDNTRGGNVVKHYINKMEKEVGKKINMRSSQTNSAFQKLFGLPPEEFLINYFTCHLKRKMPLQGRLFVSARIIGFHANLFGHETKNSFCFGRTLKTSMSSLPHFHQWEVQ